MSIENKIFSYVIEYVKLKTPNFKGFLNGKVKKFTCPFCGDKTGGNLTCVLIPGTYKIRCTHCNKTYGYITDLVRLLEADKKDWLEDDILIYLKDLFKIEGSTEKEIIEAFDFYEKCGFDLVPIVRNQKFPIELEWTKKEHKDKEEWKEWLKDNLNIGVKTGKCSNLIVIDIDTKIIPEEFKAYLNTYLMQETEKGYHLFFLYDEDFPKTRIDDLKIDVETTGGQVVLFPSIVNGKCRILKNRRLEKMPEELKKLLISKITLPNLKTYSERLREEITTENFNLAVIPEGNRNNSLLHLGGILRKEMNINQVAHTLNVVNKHFCKPPLPIRELDTIINSLDKYMSFDNVELSNKVLQYMKVVEETTARDIREALGEIGAEGKQRIDKAIAFLVKEGLLFKRRRMYNLIKRAEWRETWQKETEVIDFTMPYFGDSAVFRNADMIIIGGTPKCGKTHIALNIIKKLIAQGKKPYYVSLESGNRFASISKQLGLAEGQFKWCVHFNPQDIEIEKNAITIIDWLLPNDYAETDKLFKYFAEQLVKNGGILIVFVQLKDNGDFFANNMISMFPAFVCKYLYDDETKGDTGKFVAEYIREPKLRGKSAVIPCFYNWDTKDLTRIDENKQQPVVIKESEEGLIC
jgi:hypothetical protein